MAGNINRVVLVGNLTRDPELRHTPSGTPVCSLRLAVNTRRKDESGQWTDKPNYFDITVWGQQGENCAQYLSKGRPVAIDGRLEWREWEAQDGVEAPGRRGRRRERPVPRRAPGGRGAAYVPAGASRRGRRRLPDLAGRRRHSVLSCARPEIRSARISGRAKIPEGGCFAAASQLAHTTAGETDGTEETATTSPHRPDHGARQAQELPLLPGQGRTRSTTRTSRSSAATSPRRGRSAPAGSRARAAGTRSRSRGGEARARDGPPPYVGRE